MSFGFRCSEIAFFLRTTLDEACWAAAQCVTNAFWRLGCSGSATGAAVVATAYLACLLAAHAPSVMAPLPLERRLLGDVDDE